MRILTVNTVVINRKRSEVYEFATNLENFKLWFPEVVEIASANSLAHGFAGKKYLETVRIPFKGESKISINVTKAEENELFITEGDFSPLLPKMTMKFSEESANTTMLTWSMQSRNNSLIFKFVFFPIFKKTVRRRAKIGMQNLKAILEN